MPNYEQRASGLWTVRFRETVNGQEKFKRLSGFKTKKEAQMGYHEYLNNKVPNDSNILWQDLLTAYLDYSKSRTRESSYLTSLQKIHHFEHAFDNKKLKDIKPLDILEWQKTITGFSFSYQQAIVGFCRSIFRFGELYYNNPNPFSKVTPIRNKEGHKEMQFWTLQEYNTFISFADNQLYHAVFSTLYYTGLRKGELLALKIADLSNSTLNISKSLTRKTSNGIGYKITAPKNNNSYRKVSIPDKINEELLQLTSGRSSEEFIFGGITPISDKCVDRAMERYCKLSGVKKIRIHDIRHSHASYLLSNGASIIAVSRRLGHGTPTQTLNTYAHMMPEDSDLILNLLNK